MPYTGKEESGARLDGPGLLRLLWGDREEPYFDINASFDRSKPPLPKEEALALAAQISGTMYFSPTPRCSLGNTKADCAPTANILWAEVDRTPNHAVAALVEEALAAFAPLDLIPTVMVWSGNKGLHLYWKLDTDLPIERIEDFNKALINVIDGDSCWNRTRLLRVPGSINDKSGKRVEVVHVSGIVYSLSALDRLGVVAPSPRRATREPGQPKVHSDEWAQAAETLGGWEELEELDLSCLTGQMIGYLRERPGRGWGIRRYPTRSHIEQAIVYRLIGAGASDDQLIALADEYFAKHREKSDDHYIQTTIDNARAHHYENGKISSPVGGYPHKRDAKWRMAAIDELERYLDLVGGQLVSEWVAEVMATGRSRSSAYRYKDGLLRAEMVEIRDRRIYRAF